MYSFSILLCQWDSTYSTSFTNYKSLWTLWCTLIFNELFLRIWVKTWVCYNKNWSLCWLIYRTYVNAQLAFIECLPWVRYSSENFTYLNPSIPSGLWSMVISPFYRWKNAWKIMNFFIANINYTDNKGQFSDFNTGFFAARTCVLIHNCVFLFTSTHVSSHISLVTAQG